MIDVYADGGVILKNPSPHGGTWAWCHIAEHGVIMQSMCGVVEMPGVTNNQTEFMAAVRALEALPDGWSGRLHSDSQVTLGRLCQGWALNGLSTDWITRASTVLQRLGRIEPVLLQGHPTLADLRRGIGSRGYQVSKWNVWCDAQCQKLAREYLAKVEKHTLEMRTW